MQHKTRLNDRSVLTISGVQASSFLQGLITNDMGQLEGQKAIYAALLTPQGKILYDFILSRVSDEGFHIDCATTQKSALLKRLNLYRLRAKVEITDPAIEVAAAWGEENPPALPGDTMIFMDPRLPELGHRIIASRDVLNTHFGQDDGSYRAHQLMLGVPDSADIPPDTIFALDAGFEELSGVSFSKGCYVGQEVTSRMKHRTSARKRFFIVEANGQYPPGTPLEAAGREIGALSSQIGKFALAHLRMDRLAEAEQENRPITIAGNEIIIRRPEWLDAPLAAS
jgi:folate-binding protein YgfZ